MRRSVFVALVVGVFGGLGVQWALAQPVDPFNPKFRNVTVTNSLAVSNDVTVGDDLTVTDTTKTELLDAGNINVAGRIWTNVLDAGAGMVANNLSVGGTVISNVASGSTSISLLPGAYISLDRTNNNSFIRGPTSGVIELSTGSVVPGADSTTDLGSGSVQYRNTYSESYYRNTQLTISSTAPTVTACSGGTAATITWSNGTAAFQFDVGTACTSESTAVITFPAAATGWTCSCSSTTADRLVLQRVMPNASTTQVTMQNIVISTGANGDWTDGADVACKCLGG